MSLRMVAIEWKDAGLGFWVQRLKKEEAESLAAVLPTSNKEARLIPTTCLTSLHWRRLSAAARIPGLPESPAAAPTFLTVFLLSAVTSTYATALLRYLLLFSTSVTQSHAAIDD